MPKIRRQSLPQQLMEHLIDRVGLREISAEDLIALRNWLDSNPQVPVGPWFKRFDRFSLCGRGELIKTLLSRKQSPVGEQVF